MKTKESVEAKNRPQGNVEGILLVNKPKGKTSFSLVRQLRKRLGVKKIGHAGTLDPFATGVMVMLVGRSCTKLSDQLLTEDKEYLAQMLLGVSTDSFDHEGAIVNTSDKVPTTEEVFGALTQFQGEILQTPPMFSAKKIGGQKLYDLARKGIEIERKPCLVKVAIEFVSYSYPVLTLKVACSKGTYIRSLAHDIGAFMGCWAHLTELTRLRSGQFVIGDCIDGGLLYQEEDSTPIEQHLISPADFKSFHPRHSE
ncbi:tRNA pseudouridine(55) synthase TruB [Estrella lausannensis]|uniref:tRNA pseudouridine synthase B n=1 Tax=Estrella lausannensis TaxID=483423 RepID=A0A0H5DRH6_9BACT|nr:tRNA pseudouridine(55) synthase TruB [Estrella lausannensis]CRX39301.1 tRNA pseudouridine synthase B [Estrella lausannensis]